MSVIAFAAHGLPRGQFARLAETPARAYAEVQTADATDLRIGDLGPDDHALVYASSRALTCRRNGVRCNVSLLLLEPRVVQRRFYAALPLIAPRFHRVFMHHAPLAERVPNARLVWHGGSWLRAPVDPLGSRVARMSLIASTKAATEGQRLRHRVASWAAAQAIEVRLLGRGYAPFEDRAEGFLPYRYSVVIENSRDPGYFTEKIVDCLRCGTVPIYWGDPEIGRRFEIDGIIACRDEAEIRRAMLDATVDGFASRRGARARNAALADGYADNSAEIVRILRSDS